MRLAIIILAGLALAGCETMGAVKEKPIEFTSSDFCIVSTKWKWSVNDTPETIDAARRHNAKWDRLCRHNATS